MKKQKTDRAYLREWRLAKGLTQPELAKRIGTVKSEISRLENGSRGMTLDWMSALSKAMNISAEDLLTLPPMGFGAVAPAPRSQPEKLGEFFKFSNIEISIDDTHDVATVTGDDWAGMFQPGDLLIYDKGKKTTAVPGIMAFDVGGEKLIRRVMPDGLMVMLSCANPAYPPVNLTSDYQVLGRVVARLHRV